MICGFVEVRGSSGMGVGGRVGFLGHLPPGPRCQEMVHCAAQIV